MPYQETVTPPSDIFLYILAIFLPPLAVFFKRGCAGAFWINVVLTLFAWLPGVIHAWYVIAKSEERVAYTSQPARYGTY